MTIIGSGYGVYVPPMPPPTAPPSPTSPEDPPRSLDLVIVTASSKESTASIFRQAYGGLTGAQENSRRNEEWATSSPSQRAEAMGMSAAAMAGEDLGGDGDYMTLELNDTEGWNLTEVDNKPSIGVELALEFFFTPNPVNYNDPGIWRENALSAAYPKLPTDWGVRLSTKGTGLMWANPSNNGTNVRVMKGDPGATHASQRVDYVKVQVNGRSILSDGSSVESGANLAAAHIPLKQWLTWPRWSSPR